MSHDEIDDWYYSDEDEDDVRVFDPNAIYRSMVDDFDDFDDPEPIEDEDDELEGFDDFEEEEDVEFADNYSDEDEE